MDVRIKTLRLKNFKGIESFTLDANGSDATIFGDNGTGKTTIFDAFTWLLYDKDSLNSAQFDIKPLNGLGEAQHGNEHSVEGVLLIDGAEITLKKVYTEIWTKRRGSAQKGFTGHTSEYFIDGVPVKLKEYKDRISSLCEESVSKLLTNPRYFNEILSWQDRRKMLLEVCGNVSDEDVIRANADLAELPGIIGKHSMDDYKKIVASRRSEINKELEKIPVRIDEIKGSMVETRSMNEIEAEIKLNEALLTEKQRTLSEVRNGGNAAVLTSRIRDIENQIREIDGKVMDAQLVENRKRNEEGGRLHKIAMDASTRIGVARAKKLDLGNLLRSAKAEAETRESERVRLAAEWYAEDDKVFTFEQSSACPTCGQELPEEQLEAARTKALESFNLAKAEAKRKINETGMAVLKRRDERNEEARRYEAELATLESEIQTLQAEADAAENARREFDKARPAPFHPVASPERDALLKQQADLEARIKEAEASTEESTRDIRAQIVTIEAHISTLAREQLQHQANQRIDARVKELSERERELSAEYEKLEGHLYLIEQFIRARVGMLEEQISGSFSTVRFKLFENQINDGLKECCIVTVNGVPYWSANNAARINAGIDICNTLSAHFGKTLPMFCDNAEAVTDLMSTIAQQIKLVVSEQDKKLRVKTQAGKKAA